MKIISPFVQYIPQCKKNMRRLRKKIYKFITSKNYHRKNQENKKDLIKLFRQKEVPSFLIEALSKRKLVDLNAIKNLNVPIRLTHKQIIEVTEKQEQFVSQNHKEWIQTTRQKNKQKIHEYIEGIRQKQLFAKRTLSSTQFQCDQEYDDYEPQSNQYEELAQQEINQNLNQDIQFHHFERGNSFLEIESSILSQENLFKF